ncbi:MAG: hypothetical protein KKH94_00785, partial [Candidatus Omnitrophica bacterium]|nr:hypothetical protein [Candidatus Omnitrophota bacterium]
NKNLGERSATSEPDSRMLGDPSGARVQRGKRSAELRNEVEQFCLTFACMRCFCPLPYFVLIIEKGKNMGEVKMTFHKY